VAVSYLYDNNRKIEPDEFSKVTKNLLAQGQCLVEVSYQQDVTSLHKNANCGTQNMIDPYNIFMYPLDAFVYGSEYSTFYTGNSSRSAANVLPQNFFFYLMGLKYGLTSRLNAGVRVGYRSSSRLHHFTLGTPNQVYDLKNRYYQFKPYYFFDVLSDWRLTRNSIISVAWHYVPEYDTLVRISGLAKEFKTRDEYGDLAVNLKVLF
jgi:hypothetical protein